MASIFRASLCFLVISDILTDLQVDMVTDTMSGEKGNLCFDFAIALWAVGLPTWPSYNSIQNPNCDLVKASEHTLSWFGLICNEKCGSDFCNQIWQKSVDLLNNKSFQSPTRWIVGASTQSEHNNLTVKVVLPRGFRCKQIQRV
jgi:hypothetical protein